MTLSPVHLCHLLQCQHCTCVHFRRAPVFTHLSSHRVAPVSTLRTVHLSREEAAEVGRLSRFAAPPNSRSWPRENDCNNKPPGERLNCLHCQKPPSRWRGSPPRDGVQQGPAEHVVDWSTSQNMEDRILQSTAMQMLDVCVPQITEKLGELSKTVFFFFFQDSTGQRTSEQLADIPSLQVVEESDCNVFLPGHGSTAFFVEQHIVPQMMEQLGAVRKWCLKAESSDGLPRRSSTCQFPRWCRFENQSQKNWERKKKQEGRSARLGSRSSRRTRPSKRTTIFCKMITVLTRCSSIVFELR